MKKRKNKKRRITAHKILGFLFTICSIIFLGVVLLANVLPIKYLAIFIGVLLFLNVIINFFLGRRKIKKKPRRFFTILALLFSILFLGASFFIYRTLGFLDDVSMEYKTYTYSILVKSDSKYQKLSDLVDKNLGYYNDNSEVTKKALGIVSEKCKLTNEGYGNLDSLGADLFNAKVDAILVSDSQKTKLNNSGSNSKNSKVSGFKDKVRVIYTFKVRMLIKSDGLNITNEVFNIYISGMDEYGKVREISRSDVNMVVTVNPKTRQILLTNIPRDYYVQIHDTDGYKDKLTHAGIYGVDTSLATIEDLLGIKINYYVKVNFSSLVNIVDALGGVEVYSEYDFRSWNGYNFSKGYNKVNGKEALSFVRERKQFNDGDNQRGKNQQAMIEAIFRKCTKPSIIIKYNSLLDSLKDSMITDMPTKNMMKLAKMQLRDSSKWTITSNSLTGTGSMDYTYTYPYQSLYVTVPDEDSVKLSKEMINKVINGDLLESSYNSESSNVHSVTKTSVYTPASNNSSSNSAKKATVSEKKAIVKKQEIVKEDESAKEEITEPVIEKEEEKDKDKDKEKDNAIDNEKTSNPPVNQKVGGENEKIPSENNDGE